MNFATLLRALTLGTARRPLPAEVRQWLARTEATDPEADEAEGLLAALAVGERLHRTGGRQLPPDVVRSATAATPQDTRPTTDAALTRATELVLNGPYAALLPELINVVDERGLVFAPRFLPALLDHAVEAGATAGAGAAAGAARTMGGRGAWLAGLNPDWAALDPAFDYAAAFAAEGTPGGRLGLLRRWRARDPGAARAALEAVWADQSARNQELLLAGLEPGLGAADVPFLTRVREPKRAGVRRAAAALLLRAGDAATLADFRSLARAALTETGRFRNVFAGPAEQALLKTYGGAKRRETPAAYLLERLPPTDWAELTGRPPVDFFADLTAAGRAAAARALVRYAAGPELTAPLLRTLALRGTHELPPEEARPLVNLLPRKRFAALYDELLTREANLLQPGNPALRLALLRATPWNERLTRAAVTVLRQHAEAAGRAGYRDLEADWRAAIPRLDPRTLPWLEQQLRPLLERPDRLGRLATETLQTTAFRQQWHD